MMWFLARLKVASALLLLVIGSRGDSQSLHQNTSHPIQLGEHHTPCPTWYMQVNQTGDTWCVCTDKVIQGSTIVRCPKEDRVCLTCEGQVVPGRDDLNVSIKIGYYLTRNFRTQGYMLAGAPYTNHFTYSRDLFVTVPSNISELNYFMCNKLRRHGDLCEHCGNNTGPSILGLGGHCNVVRSTVYRWSIFIFLELAIPTLIFFLILCCKVRATTGPLNAFIIFCQMLYAVFALKLPETSNAFEGKSNEEWHTTAERARSVAFELLGSLCTLWYGEYMVYLRFSVSANISSIQVKALQYLPALYPLFLVVLSYIIVRLHYNGCRVLIVLWRPFRYCKSRLGINWEPLSSIIHTFATFILLVYTKIVVVSYNLLASSRVYNETGELPYKIVYYDTSIRFLSHQHLPYVILALSMLTVFGGLPVLVLLLYPMACFQRFLSKTTSPHFRQVLRIFTEAYTGCYKDKTMPRQSLDCRYFASLYFLFRVVYLTRLFFTPSSYLLLAIIISPLLVSYLFAFFQPYKNNWLNIVDSTFFALVGLGALLYAYNIHISKVPLWLPNSLAVVPMLYFISFVSYKAYARVKECCTKYRTGRGENVGLDEEFQFERERSTESSPLINPTHVACN